MNPKSDRGKASLIILVLLAGGFIVATLWLLNTRLSKGDTYPKYSTFRADPMGTRVIYEALGRMDGVEVERNTRRLKRVEPDGDAAIWFLGLDPKNLYVDEETGEEELIDGWLKQGSRVVIALSAKAKPAKRERPAWFVEPEDSPEVEDGEGEDEDTLENYVGMYGLTTTRGKMKDIGLPQQGEGEFKDLRLPVWRGTHQLILEPGSDWQALAVAGDSVTMAMLKREQGDIIVVADAYPLSNEAQANERHTAYLLALLGDYGRIVMDESHQGVVVEPGLVSLVRHYHMQGLLIGGLVLFVFLLWQGGGSLIPVDDSKDLGENESGSVSGRDSSGGLVSLLEVGLKPNELMRECVDRHLSAARGPKPDPDGVEQARAIAAASRKGKLAEDYTRITKLFRP